MTVEHLHRTLQWLFVVVIADSLVALVLRAGSLDRVLRGDHSWATLLALFGLGCMGLLLMVSVRTAHDLLRLWQQVSADKGRITALEASSHTSLAHGFGRPSPQADFGRDVAIARQRVLDVLERGNLTIAMQPIVDLNRDRWVAVEALSRFPDGRSPDMWFREAQEMGLGVDLELLALTTTLTHAQDLPDGIRLSINASPSLILDPRMAASIYRSGVALERITLEITEHAAVTEYDEIKDALLLLRERGVHLAVDDTGAGYASFTHVLRLRPDVIKLDRSMVVGIGSDPAKRAFVTAVVLLGLELDATITAEGIETRDELETVVALGIDHAQGFELARPDTSVAVWRSWAQRRWLAQVGVGAASPAGHDGAALRLGAVSGRHS